MSGKGEKRIPAVSKDQQSSPVSLPTPLPPPTAAAIPAAKQKELSPAKQTPPAQPNLNRQLNAPAAPPSVTVVTPGLSLDEAKSTYIKCLNAYLQSPHDDSKSSLMKEAIQYIGALHLEGDRETEDQIQKFMEDLTGQTILPIKLENPKDIPSLAKQASPAPLSLEAQSDMRMFYLALSKNEFPEAHFRLEKMGRHSEMLLFKCSRQMISYLNCYLPNSLEKDLLQAKLLNVSIRVIRNVICRQNTSNIDLGQIIELLDQSTQADPTYKMENDSLLEKIVFSLTNNEIKRRLESKTSSVFVPLRLPTKKRFVPPSTEIMIQRRVQEFDAILEAKEPSLNRRMLIAFLCAEGLVLNLKAYFDAMQCLRKLLNSTLLNDALPRVSAELRYLYVCSVYGAGKQRLLGLGFYEEAERECTHILQLSSDINLKNGIAKLLPGIIKIIGKIKSLSKTSPAKEVGQQQDAGASAKDTTPSLVLRPNNVAAAAKNNSNNSSALPIPRGPS